MATKKKDRLTEVIKEIEALAKRLRADLRRAANEAGLTKNLERAAAALRKQMASLAAQVEKYVHELRMELSKPMKVVAAPKKAAPRKRAAKRRA
jgi:hypothetical protein